MNKEQALAKLAERQQMLDNVANFVEQKKTPILENLFKWKFLDTEIEPKPTPWEIMTNWDLMEKVVREHQERYDPDLCCDIGTRNNMNINATLGHSQHQMKEKESGNIQAVDEDRFGSAEALLEYAKNPTEYCWTKASRITFPDGLTFGQIEDACRAVNEFNAYAVRINRIMNEEYGVPATVKAVSICPTESPAMYYRGLKAFSTDMRRKPEVIDEYNRIMTPGFLKAISDACDSPRGNTAYEDWAVLLTHSIMNTKQFERFMWNGIWGEAFRILAEKKGKALMFIEASGLRLADFFNEVPRGVITCYFELDDPFEMRKAMPNIAFAYYPQTYLQYHTPAEAVDKAKELVEGMGPGYMYCTNKMIEHANDQRRENVFAVYDYLRNR
ncbi:MAG: hypothetical protein IKD81_04200 [Eubacteriaceae bacterium]|nr:hypothetical protein [Eubacteriaceae bacterium]